MPPRCTVCAHDNCGDIDRAIIAGKSQRGIARRFNLHKDAVWRHAQHLPQFLAKAHSAEQVARADELITQLQKAIRRARKLERAAAKKGDTRAALQALAVQTQQTALLEKIRPRVRITETRETTIDEVAVRRRVSLALGIGGPLIPRIEAGHEAHLEPDGKVE